MLGPGRSTCTISAQLLQRGGGGWGLEEKLVSKANPLGNSQTTGIQVNDPSVANAAAWSERCLYRVLLSFPGCRQMCQLCGATSPALWKPHQHPQVRLQEHCCGAHGCRLLPAEGQKPELMGQGRAHPEAQSLPEPLPHSEPLRPHHCSVLGWPIFWGWVYPFPAPKV